ncbi:MAG: inositol monophosphatase [Patescibacteria group bacterium]|nr:inositol monophosphatase [Patescibacteria group bacterium]MDD5715569.1 inositol monophosphatase [Patescibacteria group bacterium]
MTHHSTIAIRAARLAGACLMKYYQRLRHTEIHRKSEFDRVTRADFQANKIILGLIKKHFPTHDILSEETGLEDHPDIYEWVIDPIDGTTNYIIGNPLFCTAIALRRQGRILVSVEYAPALNELYYAEDNGGAFLNGKRIRVSPTALLRNSIITLARSRANASRQRYMLVQRQLQGRALNMRHFGSTSLTLAFVAAGRVAAGVVVPPGITSWDILPGVLLVHEAGGTVTDYTGKPWTIHSQGVVATNGRVRRQLLKVLHP